MDATAISLCMDNKLPIVVFNLREPGNVRRVDHGRADRHDGELAGKRLRPTSLTDRP